VGFEDECWWSRVSDPGLHTWAAENAPLRLHSKEDAVPKGEPKALSCYGLWLPDAKLSDRPGGRMLLRFVSGRPVSAVTVPFLEWVSQELAAAGKQVLFLVWDNASWHGSAQVRGWLREHNRQVKQGDKVGIRIVVCPLPKRSPWLNPIEPKWLHGKRNVAETDRVLGPEELMERVHAYYGCAAQPMLSKAVS
jgi:hypothetical protein